jgi:hypothetical protein
MRRSLAVMVLIPAFRAALPAADLPKLENHGIRPEADPARRRPVCSTKRPPRYGRSACRAW